MDNEKPLPGEYNIGVALGIILSIVTCGLYNIYWNYLQFKAMNILLGREEYQFWKWLGLSILTCGIYHIYYEYKMGADIYAYMKGKGIEVNPNLHILGVVLAVLGLTVVVDAIYQHELNRLTA